MMRLQAFVPNQIWIQSYPVRYAGADFDARMSVIRLNGTDLLLHSPAPIDSSTLAAIAALGDVRAIVAPGSFHYRNIASAQRAFPHAETYICPGVERKCPGLRFDWIMGPTPPADWRDTLDQVLIRGSRFMWEVAMYHRLSRTLLLVDAIEHFTDGTPNVSWQLKAWFKWIFRMWNKPGLAPEYRFGWYDRQAARASLEQILAWDFERIVIAHGDNITSEAKDTARRAWRTLVDR